MEFKFFILCLDYVIFLANDSIFTDLSFFNFCFIDLISLWCFVLFYLISYYFNIIVEFCFWWDLWFGFFLFCDDGNRCFSDWWFCFLFFHFYRRSLVCNFYGLVSSCFVFMGLDASFSIFYALISSFFTSVALWVSFSTLTNLTSSFLTS